MLLSKISKNMSYELTGKLLEKYDTVNRSGSFRTREFIIEKSEDFNGKTFVNYVKFQAVQDRTLMLDKFSVGDMVRINFNIRGSKWERDGKISYITNLDAWRLELISNTSLAGSELIDKIPDYNTSQEQINPSPTSGDDLPF